MVQTGLITRPVPKNRRAPYLLVLLGREYLWKKIDNSSRFNQTRSYLLMFVLDLKLNLSSFALLLFFSYF